MRLKFLQGQKFHVLKCEVKVQWQRQPGLGRGGINSLLVYSTARTFFYFPDLGIQQDWTNAAYCMFL